MGQKAGRGTYIPLGMLWATSENLWAYILEFLKGSIDTHDHKSQLLCPVNQGCINTGLPNQKYIDPTYFQYQSNGESRF